MGPLAPILAALVIFGAQPEGARELRRLEAIVADPGSTAVQREQAADAARRLRPRLIASAGPDSLEAPVWLLDQARAELARIERDGTDLAVMFGLATDGQWRDVARAASEAEALVRSAEARIARMLADADAAPVGSLREDRYQALRRLRDDEAGLRAPYYRGRATLLLSAVSANAGEAEAALRWARASAAALRLTEAADPVVENARRISAAIALLRSGEQDAARAALERIARPAGPAPGSDEIDSATHAEALLALADLHSAREGADAGASWLLGRIDARPFASDPLLTIIAHDACVRMLIEEPGAGQAARRRAVSVIMGLLERDNLGLSEDVRRALVGERLDRLLSGADLSAYPVEALALWAINAAQYPARREEAITALRDIASRTDDAELREMVLFEAAALLLDREGVDQERIEGVVILIAMLENISNWPRAAEAARAAAAHGRALYAEAPDDPDRRALLERTLRACIGALPDREAADRWRLDLARLAVSQGQTAQQTDEALALLEAIDPLATVAAQADELAGALHLRAIERARARAADDDPAGADARAAAVERAAGAALAWAEARASPLEDRFRLELGEALLGRGAGEEAEAQLAAIRDAAGLPGGAPRVRLALAKARRIAGDEPGAFRDLLNLAQALDGPGADGAIRPQAFWEAWTLLLEILQGRNDAGERTDDIRAHILRLRDLDPQLGGEPWNGRITQVELLLRR